jgi:hypothetical protein
LDKQPCEISIQLRGVDANSATVQDNLISPDTNRCVAQLCGSVYLPPKRLLHQLNRRTIV